MKLTVIQPDYPTGTADASACMAWMRAQLESLRPGEQDIVLLPEYANTPGIEEQKTLHTCAESSGTDFLQNVAASAQRLGCLIATGAVVREGEQWFNRTLLFDASGEVVFHYDKIHLTTTESRDLGLTAGSTSPIFEYELDSEGRRRASSRIAPPERSQASGLPLQTVATNNNTLPQKVRIGFATCFDLYFPEHFVALAEQQVDLILCPSYQRSESAERIRLIAQMRALDTGCYLARSSYAMPTPDHGGHSLIAAPDGTLLADTGHQAGVITTQFDPHQKFTKPASHGQPPIEHRALIESHRRPEMYRK